MLFTTVRHLKIYSYVHAATEILTVDLLIEKQPFSCWGTTAVYQLAAIKNFQKDFVSLHDS